MLFLNRKLKLNYITTTQVFRLRRTGRRHEEPKARNQKKFTHHSLNGVIVCIDPSLL